MRAIAVALAFLALTPMSASAPARSTSGALTPSASAALQGLPPAAPGSKPSTVPGLGGGINGSAPFNPYAD